MSFLGKIQSFFQAGLLGWLILSTLAGCAASDPAPAFNGVEKEVASRAGAPLDVRWNHDAAADAAAERAVQSLLRRGPLTAQTAAQIAVLNNQSLQADFEGVGIAQAEYVQAGLLGNPEFSASWRFPGTPPYATDAEYALAANILDLFLLPARRQVAARELARTKLRVTGQALGLIAEAKEAVYALEADQQLLGRLRLICAADAAEADLAERLHAAGNITDLDFNLRQTPVAQAQVETLKVQMQIRSGRERLNRLLGLSGAAAAGWTVAASLPAIPAREKGRPNLETIAVHQRLDLADARANVDTIGQALALRTKTRYLPASITLGVDTERETTRQHVTGPTLDLQLPIFDQGQGAVAKLVAQDRQARRELAAAEVNARSEVREAAALVNASRVLVQRYAQTLVPQRRAIVAGTQLQYDAMQVGGFDLLSAREQELSTERAYIEAWRDYWLAQVGLERALTGGSEAEPTPSAAGRREIAAGVAGIIGNSASTRAAAVKGAGE